MFRTEDHDPFRVLLYSHDSVGLGHIRRNLALAHTLTAQIPSLTGRQVTGMLLTGVGHGADLDVPEGFDVALLPGISKGGNGYRPRHMQVPMGDLISIREQMVRGVVNGLNPDLIIVDRHPFGVDGELRSTLAATRRRNPDTTIVLGLREVLDEPDAVAAEWAALGELAAVRDIFDEIWVYGDPRVHDVRETGEVPDQLHDLIRYTGYLASGRRCLPQPDPTELPYVLSMAGGGSDGLEVLTRAAQAAVPPGHRHLVVAGPQMPAADLAAIQRVAAPGTIVVAKVPDGLATIRRASALVAMAGYNTVCEALTTNTPVLLVPRERPRREQLIRASGLAAAGAVDVTRLEELTPERLAEWLAGAVRRTTSRDHLDLAGLPGVAGRVAALQSHTPLRVPASVKEFPRVAV